MIKFCVILLVGVLFFHKAASAFIPSFLVKDSVVTVVIEKGDTVCVIPKVVTHTRKIFDMDSLQDRIYLDTVHHQYIIGDTTKGSKHISNIIAKNLFKTITINVDSTLQKISKFNQYEGLRIDSVVVIRNNIFDIEEGLNNNSSRRMRSLANDLNYITRESAIRRYLLFKKGDTVVPEDLIRSEALLRDIGGISKANIRLDEKDGRVIAYVTTSDNWSIMAQLYYRVTNNGMIKLSDLDFLGTGNRLDLNEYFNIDNREWLKALELNYFIPNFLGEFIGVNIGGGYGKNFHSATISADKFFVKPNDWAGGLKYNRRKEESHLNIENIFTPIDKQVFNAWFGQSLNISKKWGDNIFYTAKVEGVKFFERPYHTATYSPYFHNTRDVLGSIGLYKEKFYRGNMIYGYGRTESISYGYKVELITGYRAGEYDQAPYVGADLSMGNMVKLGYISGRVSFGTFIGNTTSLHQTKLNVDLLYFTRLQQLSSGLSMRQFLNMSYSSGIRTLDGYIQELNFQNNNLLSSVTKGARGTTRFRMNPETVFFSPFHVSGFKFALFGFTDFGTIGYSTNPFKNNFYATAGCGVRIRNESLIFKTVQFRIIISIKGNKEFRNNLFYLNSEPPLSVNRYIPKEPQIIELK